MAVLPRRSRRRTGGAVVEFAIVSTFLFIVIFAFVEFGRVYMVEEALDHAARAGVRQASIPQETVTNTISAVTTAAQQLKVPASALTITMYLNQYQFSSSSGYSYQYTPPAWSSTPLFTGIGTSSPTTTQDSTLQYAPMNSLIEVQVSVGYSSITWSPLPVVFNTSNTFTATAIMRRE